MVCVSRGPTTSNQLPVSICRTLFCLGIIHECDMFDCLCFLVCVSSLKMSACDPDCCMICDEKLDATTHRACVFPCGHIVCTQCVCRNSKCPLRCVKIEQHTNCVQFDALLAHCDVLQRRISQLEAVVAAKNKSASVGVVYEKQVFCDESYA
jgi:hypothetical protein